MTFKHTFTFLLILTWTFDFTQKVTRFHIPDSASLSGTYTTWQIKYADNNTDTCELCPDYIQKRYLAIN